MPQSSGKVDTNWDSNLSPQSVVLFKELRGKVSKGKLELLGEGNGDKGEHRVVGYPPPVARWRGSTSHEPNRVERFLVNGNGLYI